MPFDRSDVCAALNLAMNTEVAGAMGHLDGLKGSLEGEAKSTAGDKHETGRAMVQLEMEQAINRLKRLEDMVLIWSRMHPELERSEVRPGALVHTSMGSFVIGVAWGAFPGGEQGTCRAISSDAPLALALQGRQAGDTVEFRGNRVEVLGVM